jgi:hypothetical protein
MNFDNGVDAVTDFNGTVNTGDPPHHVRVSSYGNAIGLDEIEIDLAMLAAAGGTAAASAEIARQVRERVLNRLRREFAHSIDS